jgi:hypothetical protein
MLAMTAPMPAGTGDERIQWEPASPARRAPRSASAAPRSSSSVSRRTYTRRRIVAALVLTVLVLVAWAALRTIGTALPLAGSESSTSMVPVASSTYVVQPGETLWSVARRLDPDGDPRPVVDRLAAANGGTQIQAGEVIVLPLPARG